MRLYTYFRSSAAYRVRIALHLKGLSAEQIPVHLVRGGGEQHGATYRAVNPAGLVPALETDGGAVLAQSLAIIEYLDEIHPLPPLLPCGPLERARIRAFAHAIACDIHPLNNLRVLQYLKRGLGQEQGAIDAWYRHWIAEGLPALETMARNERGRGAGPFLFGPQPTLADICLVPQLANARRYDCTLGDFPLLLGAETACKALPAFSAAAPENQPDAG